MMFFSEVAAIVAIIGAVVSPVISTYLNKRHQEKMKRLEYEHQDKLEEHRHQREIYEGYIRAAGACVQSATTEALQEFGEHSALAMYYVPEDIRQDMMQLEKINRYKEERTQRVELLNQIIGKLRESRSVSLSACPHPAGHARP